MLRSVQIKDYMIQEPVTVFPDEDLFSAVHAILVNKISGVCVIDEQHRLLGVLSEMDCLKAVLDATYNERNVGMVKEFMITDVVTASLHDDIISLATDMQKKKHRRRPVIDEDGKLVGQVTCRSLLRAVKSFATKPDPLEEQLR